MLTTSVQCMQRGIYRSQCYCTSLVTLSPGLYFPSCIGCGQRVGWELTTEEEAYHLSRDHWRARSRGGQEDK
jgi:hypothetical protein